MGTKSHHRPPPRVATQSTEPWPKHAEQHQEEEEGVPPEDPRTFSNSMPRTVQDCKWVRLRFWWHRFRSWAWLSCCTFGGNSECRTLWKCVDRKGVIVTDGKGVRNIERNHLIMIALRV